MADLEAEAVAGPPTLEDVVDAQVFGGGVYHFDAGVPNHKPIEPREGDIELMLQGMIVRPPEEPIYINDEPYVFEVDEERLIHAVQRARTHVDNRGRWEPRMLEISLVDSLPSKIEDNVEPDTDPDDAFYERSYPFMRQNNTLNVELPTEVTQTSADTDDLVGQVETAANRQLAVGLEQIVQMKTRKFMERFKIAGWATAYVAAGEAAAFLGHLSVEEDDLIGKAGAGALIAASFAVTASVLTSWYRNRKHGDIRPIDTLVRQSYDAAVKKDPSLEEPIISLVPAEDKS